MHPGYLISPPSPTSLHFSNAMFIPLIPLPCPFHCHLHSTSLRFQEQLFPTFPIAHFLNSEPNIPSFSSVVVIRRQCHRVWMKINITKDKIICLNKILIKWFLILCSYLLKPFNFHLKWNILLINYTSTLSFFTEMNMPLYCIHSIYFIIHKNSFYRVANLGIFIPIITQCCCSELTLQCYA